MITLSPIEDRAKECLIQPSGPPRRTSWQELRSGRRPGRVQQVHRNLRRQSPILEFGRPDRVRERVHEFYMPSQSCELIIRESDEVLGGVIGFILASKDGLLSPNAGIDRFIRAGKGRPLPGTLDLPLQSLTTMEFRHGVHIGVVVSDSRLMPTRRGTDRCRSRCRRPGGRARPSGEGGFARKYPEGHKPSHSRRPLLRGQAGHGRI